LLLIAAGLVVVDPNLLEDAMGIGLFAVAACSNTGAGN
jgi:hypothetical protein